MSKLKYSLYIGLNYKEKMVISVHFYFSCLFMSFKIQTIYTLNCLCVLQVPLFILAQQSYVIWLGYL